MVCHIPRNSGTSPAHGLFETPTLLKVLTELDGGDRAGDRAIKKQVCQSDAARLPRHEFERQRAPRGRPKTSRRGSAGLRSVADAKHIAHEQYEVKTALPKMARPTSRRWAKDIHRSASIVGARRGCHFARAQGRGDALRAPHRGPARGDDGKLTLQASVRCQRASTRSTRRTFDACLLMMARGATLPLIELICAAAEPLTIDAAVGARLGSGRCGGLCADILLFPLASEVIGVLHKTVTDWLRARRRLTNALLEDAFFVAQDTRTGGGAGVCSIDSCWGSRYGVVFERRGRGWCSLH